MPMGVMVVAMDRHRDRRVQMPSTTMAAASMTGESAPVKRR
jgi:hypothetical protein